MEPGTTAVSLQDIEAARPAVEAVALRTPLFESRVLSEQAGAPVLFKAENLQRTGSFKVRGVSSKLSTLGDRARAGIVVASAGNHAQAAAFAAGRAGVHCEVFMPAQASVSKTEATIAYGAEVHLGGEGIDDCLRFAAARAEESGAVLVHPFDDPAIIAGQGSLGLELVEDVAGLALVVVPLGGGGLAAGVACAVKSLRPEVRVVAVQASSVAAYPVSLAEGRPVEVAAQTTLADGISVRRPGELTLPLVARYVDDVVTVGENEIANAMVVLMERQKLVVEGAGAVGVAALLNGVVEAGGGATVVVLSGGNVDSNLLIPAIRRHETHVGRRLVIFARIPDRPGSLARLLTCLGTSGANVVDVQHLREGFDIHVRDTGVHIVLETRNREHAHTVVEDVRRDGFDVEVVGWAVDELASGE